MKTRSTSILALVFVVSLFAPQTFASCTPGGACNGFIVGGVCHSYNYLSNWNFDSSCSWTYGSGASRKTDNGICGGTYSTNYAQLAYNGSPTRTTRLYQTVYIPTSSETGYVSSNTSWVVGYHVDIATDTFDHGETLQVRVLNASTNAVIASGPVYYGDTTDPDCRADSFSFTANLNGVNVKLEVKAVLPDGSEYSVFNVDDIELDQIIP
ncbi:MAG TPA: hypothetical protein VJZ00_04060 [Thermoanaerobaculia bacterium]|nr:hypothetical protein [Thermoanaerobaculia bacterium]